MPSYTIDLPHIAALARQRKDEFDVLQYTISFIEDDLPDDQLDAVIETLAAPIIEAIDCLACANCCNTLDVYLTPEDAARLAEGLSLPVQDVSDRYIDHDAAQAHGEWGKFAASPCSFLQGNRCTLYAHRPESCRAYPALTPDFRWMLPQIIAGAGRCPIIYHVVDGLLAWLEQDYYPAQRTT